MTVFLRSSVIAVCVLKEGLYYALQIIFVFIAEYSVNDKVMATLRTRDVSTLRVRCNVLPKVEWKKNLLA